MPDDNHKQPNESDTCYPLDDAAIAFFAQGVKQIEMMHAQMNGALELYLKQHKLPGKWRVAENGRELERVADAVPLPR